MEKNLKEEICTEENKVKDELKFSIVFNKSGDSFQSIMEKILINKMINN